MAKETKTLDTPITEIKDTTDLGGSFVVDETKTVIEQPKLDFITIIPKKEVKENAKKEVSLEEKPKRELVNNIHLGEIAQELIEAIKPGTVTQVNFYGLQLKFQTPFLLDDTVNSVLSRLRDAVFCAQHGKQLPKNVIVSATKSGSLQMQLESSIGLDGDIAVLDARLEVFEG